MTSWREISGLQDYVWGQNIRPISNPYLERAVVQFYEALKAGKAVQRDDPNAPPLAIEREHGAD